MSDKLSSLAEGFAIVPADNMDHLDRARSDIFKLTREVFKISEMNPASGFNNFHRHIESCTPGQFNSMRVELIKRITVEVDVSKLVFDAFEETITKLLGPDILAQRGCNLVLQPPGDPNPSELHRDAPANSPYEIVVWVPLVDCYKSKSMYILDVNATNTCLELLEKNPSDWDAFESHSKRLAHTPSVPYGSALIFFTGLLHGSEINQEAETRVSLNIRYKNLFSPSGLKNQLQFFKPLKISNLARLGASLELREHFR